HPVLQVTHDVNWTESDGQLSIQLEQVQDEPPFKINVPIEVHTNEGVERFVVSMADRQATIDLTVKSKPLWVDVDPKNALLMVTLQEKSAEELAYQFHNAQDLFDRMGALEGLDRIAASDSGAVDLGEIQLMNELLIGALSDPHGTVRAMALGYASDEAFRTDTTESVILGLLEDKNTEVRAYAMVVLAEFYGMQDVALCQAALNDRSYTVMAGGLEALSLIDPQLALQEAKKLEEEDSWDLQLAVGDVIANYGSLEDEEYFYRKMESENAYERYLGYLNYSTFISDKDPAVIDRGVDRLIEAFQSPTPIDSYAGRQALQGLQQEYSFEIETAEDPNSPEVTFLRGIVQKIASVLTTMN
ncbi:MAG: HEAT repeat domain-containing protein, partial [Flavobacteriales bacterium]|nr:HEAT repeat domain-containing protein [Flavobacteriales bacterium]